jgi:hypothetical protein
MVVGRHLFYNSSAWDSDDPAANADDDSAIAPDKTALLPGDTATFANYSSYSRGLNGIILDVSNLANPAAISASDFSFKIGNDDDPADWANAPEPSSISVRAGAGVNGSDRITIIWPNNAIQKQWLQTTLLSSAATGLSFPDVFYFGNAIGETGSSAADARVNPSDVLQARAHPRNVLNPAPLEDQYDFNRDKQVGPADQLIARSHGTSVISALRLITPP